MLARAERKGSKLDLSGAVAFKQVILPLVSALEHYIQQQKDVATMDGAVGICLALALCVVDAPMVAVLGRPGNEQLAMAPWVRVARQEAAPDAHWKDSRDYVIDFVHCAFLRRYIRERLLPFLDQSAERVAKVDDVLADGRASVPSLDGWTFEELRRYDPRSEAP